MVSQPVSEPGNHQAGPGRRHPCPVGRVRQALQGRNGNAGEQPRPGTPRRPLPSHQLLGGLLLRGRVPLPPFHPANAAGRKGRPARLTPTDAMARIGLISDTHGLLRPEALDFLKGSNHIIHAGDIGHEGILERLAALAPLTVVRGNNDYGSWAEKLPETALLEIDGVTIQAIHDVAALKGQARASRVQVVIAGHSHKPEVIERAGVLHVNPGSAGPRRFSLPVSVGELWVEAGRIEARLATLPIAATPRTPL